MSSPEKTVAQSYQEILGRAPDKCGKEHYVRLLQSGEMTLDDLKADLRKSDEHQRQVMFSSVYRESDRSGGGDGNVGSDGAVTIDTDADFDDVMAMLFSLLSSRSCIWRTVGCAYSTPLSARITVGGTAAWSERNRIKRKKRQLVYVGLDDASPASVAQQLYTLPDSAIIAFTTALSQSPIFALNKETITLHQDFHLAAEYHADSSATIIALGSLTNLAEIDAPLWTTAESCPNVIVSASDLTLPVTLPIKNSRDSNIGIDPLASMQVFTTLSKFGKPATAVGDQLQIADVSSMLTTVLCSESLSHSHRLIAQRMLDTINFTLKTDSEPPGVIWDLTATVVAYAPEVVVTRILCDVTFDSVANALSFTASSQGPDTSVPQAHVITRIDSAATLGVIQNMLLQQR